MAINKLLIANRGEIACRVILAAQEMGIRTVAVYSDADKNSLHVGLADESIYIGPSEASESYLSITKIIEAARVSSSDAIHPGYGFLSERSEFAAACKLAKIAFVGPSAASMEMLGSKMAAKALAVANNVPIVPGFFEADADAPLLAREAERMGYPILLKASAGGGGRGMRVVRSATEFHQEHKMAVEEAERAFGDGAMMIERLIENPRHVEIQFLGDKTGNIRCLFERECSIQRRHQKLMEESPAPWPGIHSAWPQMQEATVRLVRAAKYSGAGTCEFIVDPASGEFYFLEVNARLQVEHPVTEAVTGVDLVKWQIRIAQGATLPVSDLGRDQIQGHAIEVRIIAEDPVRGFLPGVGKILAWAEPKRPGIRVDSGYRAGDEISSHYDSLLAKVISHAETRPEAINRLRRALMDFHILGVPTNIGFLLDVLDHPDFQRGEFHTGWLAIHFGSPRLPLLPEELGLLVRIAETSNVPPLGSPAAKVARPAWQTQNSFR